VRYKFIIKPPLKKELEKEILELKKENKVDFELTEKGEDSPKSAKNLAKRAIKEGFERIVVCGGDGLLSEAINGIMAEKIPENFAIGVIPTGSGNNFAKALGIPKDIKKAFEIIKSEKKTLVDVGKVNQKYFINCFSLGFDAKINDLANKIKEKYSLLPRSLSYLFAALKEIIFQIPSYEIEISGEINFKEKLALVAITNSSSYGGIFKINPGASISDGKFNLCKISPVSKLKAFYTLFLTTQGKHLKIPEVKTYTFSEALKFSSKEPIIWEIDGEVQKPEKEFKVKILKNSLAFFCLK
jgi:YegS/Rv2252/BmrU family lipid kinase